MDELESNDQQDDPERDIQQPPPPIEGGGQAVNDPTGGDHGDHKKTNWPQGIEAVCAVLLVIITGTYTYYAAGQLHKMKRSTDAAERAANAAKSAADTASNALDDSRKAFQIEQRPYIVTDGMPQFITVPNVTAKMEADVTFKDIGKTPATNAIWFVDLLPYRAVARATYNRFVENSFASLRKRRDDTMTKHGQEIRRDIAPTATAFVTERARPLLVPELNDLIKGDGTFIVLVIGVANYTDGLKGVYETEFCYFFAGPDPKVWHFCDAHNTVK